MPISTDTNRTFRVVLAGDKKKNPRPAFIYRYSSCRDLRIADEYYKKIMAAKTDKDIKVNIQKRLFELLSEKLAGWENMGIKYNPKKLEDILTLPEAFELFFRMLDQRPDVEVKKKLDSPSRCSSARSAKNAKARRSAKKRSASSTAR